MPTPNLPTTLELDPRVSATSLATHDTTLTPEDRPTGIALDQRATTLSLDSRLSVLEVDA